MYKCMVGHEASDFTELVGMLTSPPPRNLLSQLVSEAVTILNLRPLRLATLRFTLIEDLIGQLFSKEG